ncbi:hypothetical protein NPIL_150051 [Nephila pilipes]|uniref:Uncharacterized protein n=1 Tax=Nephila pilipes TaxID=299642 RepID=A0A8X6P0P8_NEPPI|nr:hypothetical protein NPIL_150051 [Nephila pilipes]
MFAPNLLLKRIHYDSYHVQNFLKVDNFDLSSFAQPSNVIPCYPSLLHWAWKYSHVINLEMVEKKSYIDKIISQEYIHWLDKDS